MNPEKAIVGILLLLVIVFSEQIPETYLVFLDSTAGRILSLFIILWITLYVGWVYGLLATVGYLVSISSMPEKEDFQEQNQKNPIGSPWFVERIMREHPTQINTIQNSDSQITKNITNRNDKWFSEQTIKEEPKIITTDVVHTPRIVSDNSQKTIGI